MMRRVSTTIQACVSVLLLGIAQVAQAVPLYSVDPGIVGSNIDGVSVPIATGIDSSVAFQGNRREE